MSRHSLAPGTFALPIAILTLIVLMVLPIPTLMLDSFFVLNIALSVAILMTALNSRKATDFTAFPSVLLFATLLRLALNVASTRIVLVNGHEGEAAAGQVIASFGEFLVGGNFAVGLFVFTILIIINLVVITKGAGRVSEVSARFVLDALPGKQMAIDADVAAGLMTSEEARKRRAEVGIEADFHGAMDGASKFVKGDAIAALLILAVNVIAGIALGMLYHGLGVAEAARVYVTLAVGDALVAQVPALLLSIAAAALVTRVADASDLAGQISSQFADARGWLPVALVLGALGLIPAMPQMLFLPAGGLALWLWHILRRRARQGETLATVEIEPPAADNIAFADVSDQTLVTLELGYGLVHMVDAAKGSPLIARITGIRKQLSREFGFVLPMFRVRDSLDLGPNAYRLLLSGVELGRGEVRAERLLAIDAGEALKPHSLSGEATSDPSFGCPALWIASSQRDLAVAEGFLAVDPTTVIATHCNQLLLGRASDLLGPEEVRELIEAVRERTPGLVEAVHPAPLSLAALTRILRGLLADGISIAHPGPILTSLAFSSQRTQDFDELIDQLRIDLGAQIVARICSPSVPLNVVTLDAALEGAILGGLTDPASGRPLIEPGCGRHIADRIVDLAARSDEGLALVCQPPARRPLAALLKARAPQCLVLSINELPASQPVKVVEVIGEQPTGEMPAPQGSDMIEELAA